MTPIGGHSVKAARPERWPKGGRRFGASRGAGPRGLTCGRTLEGVHENTREVAPGAHSAALAKVVPLRERQGGAVVQVHPSRRGHSRRMQPKLRGTCGRGPRYIGAAPTCINVR